MNEFTIRPMTATETAPEHPEVSVIIPARNEEACLGACLESLVAQQGLTFEIIVVDDHSTDRTREIATSFPAVRVIDAGPLPPGWTGKNNAVATGAREASGKWLLFTDADTVHLPGSLPRALEEAKDNNADMLSYSPEQIAVTFWEMATLPVVFAELARAVSAFEGKRSEFARSRRQWPVHSDQARSLRCCRRPRCRRVRNPRRRRAGPRRETLPAARFAFATLPTPSAPACTATSRNFAKAGPRISHSCSRIPDGSP